MSTLALLRTGHNQGALGAQSAGITAIGYEICVKIKNESGSTFLIIFRVALIV
jgi:hypothetical protein